MRLPYRSTEVGYLHMPWESEWEEGQGMKYKVLGVLKDKKLDKGDIKVRITIEEVK